MPQLIQKLDSSTANFTEQLDSLLAQDSIDDQDIVRDVQTIIQQVRYRGDLAILEYTQRFDALTVNSVNELEVSNDRLQQALQSINAEQRAALETAAQRVQQYAEKQKLTSWQYEDSFGNTLGQKIQAMQRVGLYVPGGKAAYPSSVLMNAIPAKVAGVAELIMVVPAPSGVLNELVLAAAAIANVDRVIQIGGAQAIAALAYGTETVPRVDKIVGPGNIYVATAKRLVFGQVGIDMVAGPSEVVIVCDNSADPDWVAMDLFSQAEHDEAAQAIAISPDAQFLEAVNASINKLIESMPRREVISRALQNRGALIQVSDMEEAISVVNQIAPEHLELAFDSAEQHVEEIQHAGAIFVGHYAAEALGDYCAGPNHVLPTSGTARFASPLGVYDFQKRSSVIQCTAEGAAALASTAAVLAEGEGLTAHAQSAEFRKKQ